MTAPSTVKSAAAVGTGQMDVGEKLAVVWPTIRQGNQQFAGRGGVALKTCVMSCPLKPICPVVAVKIKVELNPPAP